MFIDRSMIKRVITIGKETNILEARDLMKENHIRHLPVVEPDGTLIGIVTDRDIRSAMPSTLQDELNCDAVDDKLREVTVDRFMTPDPMTIAPTYTIQDALLLIQDKKVGAFPVVDDAGKLKGIVSIRDLIRAFINVLNIGEPGMLLGILVEDKVGQLKRIVDAITEEKVSFGSVLVSRHWEEGKRAVFPYLLTNNIARIKKKLRDMGYTLLDPMEWYLDQLPKNE
ncbi:MAG: CBS and ACT domain-containing protein [Thermodesulfobacteriota bacterium]